MTIVFKLSDNLRDEVINHYKETSVTNKPPYSVFQSKDCGTVVTLYESGKIMFQGISADIDYNLWRDRESHVNKRNIDSEIESKNKKDTKKKEDISNSKFKYFSTIGSDEVGTGDYFGPIVVTASYVSKENINFLNNLGVRDSKKITDTKIMEIAPKIIKTIPHVTYILNPSDYNDKGITNMNKVKAILHNRALYSLIHKDNYDYTYIVVDQFAPRHMYFKHIEEIEEKVTNIFFTPKAEDQCYAVAAASIISRYIFLEEMKKIGQKYGIDIPKGAGNNVDDFGVSLVMKYGIDELRKVAKLNFKNTEKISEELKTI